MSTEEGIDPYARGLKPLFEENCKLGSIAH